MRVLPINYNKGYFIQKNDEPNPSFGKAYNLGVGVTQATMPVVDSFLSEATAASNNMDYDIYFAIKDEKTHEAPSLGAFISSRIDQPLTLEQLEKRGCRYLSIPSWKDFNKLPNHTKVEQLREMLSIANDHVFRHGVRIF